jgi:hypothetical protein
MDLATILDDCIRRLQTGETIEDCLASYPAHARELAPMLQVACTLQTLAQFRLPDADRRKARGKLNGITVAPAGHWPWQAFAARPAIRALAGTAIALVLVGTVITTVRASEPGDLAYPLRVAAEHSTILWQRTPDAQATVGLKLADLRLADLDVGLSKSGSADNRALAALLAEDERLAGLAVSMPAAGRSQVAERVSEHADQLDQLAGLATETETTQALREAALHTRELAGRIRAGQPASGRQLQAAPTPQPVPTVAPAPKSSYRLPFVKRILPGKARTDQSPIAPGQTANGQDKGGQADQRHEAEGGEAEDALLDTKSQRPKEAKPVTAPAAASDQRNEQVEETQDGEAGGRPGQAPVLTTTEETPAGDADPKDTGKSHAEQQGGKRRASAGAGGQRGNGEGDAPLLAPADPTATEMAGQNIERALHTKVDPGSEPRR